MELNATVFGYLPLLCIVIAWVAIGLKLAYEMKHDTKRLTNLSPRRSLAAATSFLALPSIIRGLTSLLLEPPSLRSALRVSMYGSS